MVIRFKEIGSHARRVDQQQIADLQCHTDAANWAAFKPRLENFVFALPDKEVKLKPFDIHIKPEKEGLTIPAQVNYVGKAANLYDLGYEFDGSSEVITGYLRIGVSLGKNPACSAARTAVSASSMKIPACFPSSIAIQIWILHSKIMIMRLVVTGTRCKFPEMHKNELTKAIIAAIGDLDAYQLPDAKGYTSMPRHPTGKTDDILPEKTRRTSSTNGEDFIAFGEALEKAASNAVAVIGGQAAIEGSKAGLKVTKVL